MPPRRRSGPSGPIDFSLRDLDGNSVRLGDHLGRSVILIDFWATWCVPCVKELAHFQRFHEAYADRGLLVLAITVDGPESVAMVRPFARRYKYTFPVLLDTDSRVLALYNPRVVMPYTVLIGRDGEIATVHQGYSLGDEAVIEGEILELLEPAGAGRTVGTTLSATESFLVRRFADETYARDRRAGRSAQAINQLEVSLAAEGLTAGIRWDENWDFPPWSDKSGRSERFRLAGGKAFLPAGLLDYRTIVLRKSFVEAARGAFALRAGDFYHTIGRGLGFSLLKTFEKEGLEYIVDTTVDGGRLSYAGRRFSADAFGGWITRGEEDAAPGRVVRDRVYGGSLGWRPAGLGGEVRINLVGADLAPGALLGTRNALMRSVTIDVPDFKDRLKLFGEVLLSRREKHYVSAPVNGHGVYLESGLLLGDWSILLEIKDYRRLDFEYGRPPLLETEQLPIVANQFVDAADDVRGASLRLDRNFPAAATLLFGKLTWQGDRRAGADREIAHLFGGYEKKFRETGWLTLIAGVRREWAVSPVFWDTAGSTLHAQGNVSYPLTGRYSLEADLEAKRFDGTVAFGGRYFRYEEVRSYLSFHASPRWAATILYDYTADPKILSYTPRRNWAGAKVELRFGRANAIRVFYGADKGGVKCAGGICKFFPPFEGLRIDGFLRF